DQLRGSQLLGHGSFPSASDPGPDTRLTDTPFHRTQSGSAAGSNTLAAKNVFGSAVQPQLARHPVKGAAELRAQGVRPDAQLRGDLRPAPARGALVGEPALLLRQAAAEFLQEFVRGDRIAGAGVGIDEVLFRGAVLLEAAVVPAGRPLLLHLVEELVAG